MNNHSPYLLSFTTGGLFLIESVILARLYLQTRDWKQVRSESILNNLLQVRTLASRERISREIIMRLQTLSEKELLFLTNTIDKNQQNILWLAVCRRYAFIADFVHDVLKDHVLTFKQQLTQDDFDTFFTKRSLFHPELESLKPDTVKKLRQVFFRIMREAGVISAKGEILYDIPATEILELISKERTTDLDYFPILGSGKQVLV